MEPKKLCNAEIPGFPSSLIYSKPGNEKVSTVETVIGLGTDKKRKAALSSLGTGKCAVQHIGKLHPTAILLR